MTRTAHNAARVTHRPLHLNAVVHVARHDVDGDVFGTRREERILLSDGTEVLATTSNGWFYAWWPGDATAASLAGDDATGRMVATITP